MRRRRWLFVAAAAAGVVVLVAPAVGQGKAGPASLPAGRLDPSFGRGGFVTPTSGSRGGSRIDGIALQPDGKILVAGSTALARYLPDCSIARSFGTRGV